MLGDRSTYCDIVSSMLLSLKKHWVVGSLNHNWELVIGNWQLVIVFNPLYVTAD
ncbi:hypothetical protein AVDCRST_MAG84-6003 [uncultured Microcoleus sp.]|uniref:Uncharacterized protein n=1 Tax=uncultured Microcoleus sp. TaxID=259945 RepID=A0A6J4NZU2_9CYAN|nr:hypothetical protein AVDCRST_MAG84-6003 [uncultured Microcoleus sp.]